MQGEKQFAQQAKPSEAPAGLHGVGVFAVSFCASPARAKSLGKESAPGDGVTSWGWGCLQMLSDNLLLSLKNGISLNQL